MSTQIGVVTAFVNGTFSLVGQHAKYAMKLDKIQACCNYLNDKFVNV